MKKFLHFFSVGFLLLYAFNAYSDSPTQDNVSGKKVAVKYLPEFQESGTQVAPPLIPGEGAKTSHAPVFRNNLQTMPSGLTRGSDDSSRQRISRNRATFAGKRSRPDFRSHQVTFHVSDSNNEPVADALITVTPISGFVNQGATKPAKSQLSASIDQFTIDSGAVFISSDAFDKGLPAIDFSNKDGQWISWDTGENFGGIGVGANNYFTIASRWTPADLQPYIGKSISFIQVYINNLPLGAVFKVWQGADEFSLLEMVSIDVNPIYENSWNLIQLPVPYYIDVSHELWFGCEIHDPGPGVFPAGRDQYTDYPGKGDKVKLGHDGDWANLSGYGLPGDWNIQALLTTAETLQLITNANGEAYLDAPDGSYFFTVSKFGYLPVSNQFTVDGADQDVYVTLYNDPAINTVTFNVNMTTATLFDPEIHTVYLTGTFTGWAEPGIPGAIEMTMLPNEEDKTPPYNYFEDFENFPDFTTDLYPWTTYMFNTGNTWGAGDFDFPGEGTAFAFMAFNPHMTNPPISNNHPPVSGSKYIVAIQSQTINDNKWLISPEFSLHETSQLSFMAKSIMADYGLERIRVLVSTSGTDVNDFTQISSGDYLEVPTSWTEFSFDLGNFAGETGYIAIQYVSYDAFIFMLDAFNLTAEVGSLVYTATLELADGEHQYKYFSDAYGLGWAGGEWQGDPNRVINISDDSLINDVWGIYQPPFTGFRFNKPIANQTYEVSVDAHIPVEFEFQGYNSAMYWLYLEADYNWIEISSGYLSQPGVYGFNYQIHEFLPPGNHRFALEYYIYDSGHWDYIYSNSFNLINDNEVIGIVYPDHYSIWVSGGFYEISWNSLNVPYVNISYSLDNGNVWHAIASNIYSWNGFSDWGYNYYSWNVPADIEGIHPNSLIKIESVSNIQVVGLSDNFTIRESPVRFNLPLEGQSYQTGVDTNIPVEIELLESTTGYYVLYLYYYGNWEYLTEAYMGGQGTYSYSYSLPDNMYPGEYSFVVDFYIDNPAFYGNIYSNTFTIINEDFTIDIRIPDSETIWVAGGWGEIRWNSSGINYVDIHYSIDNGANWNMIGQYIYSWDGYYEYGNNTCYWQIPSNIQGTHPQSLIKITNSSDQSEYDISEPFTIVAAPVTFINPTAQTVLAAGQPLPIIIDVTIPSYIYMILITPAWDWYWIDYIYAPAGVLTYYWNDTGWLETGEYRIFLYHEETGYELESELFTVVPAGTVYSVTFNIDMSNALDFNHSIDVVYLTGTFVNWAIPGSPNSLVMNLANAENMIYTTSYDVIPGFAEYKYFSDAYGADWAGGEWGGFPNRVIQVSGNMVVNDIWGVHMLVFFNLDLQSDPPGAGTLSGSGIYNAHQIIELHATTHDGYVFVDWEDVNGNIISLDEICTYLMPARHTSLIAKFEVETKVENDYAFDVVLFPNPANRNVKITSGALINDITITDITGKKVFSETLNNHKINISTEAFESGIYIVRIYTQQVVMVKKLIVNK